MSSRPVKVPGPDHPITITRSPKRVVVRAGGQVIADSVRALTLEEAGYPPVHYIPRADVDMSLLARTAHATWCPFKGACAYYSITPGGVRSANGAWTYEAPHQAVASIKACIAFYPGRVDSIEEQAAAAASGCAPAPTKEP